MAIHYDQIESGVKALGELSDNHEFLRSFLNAYGFPKATFARIVWPSTNTRVGVYIQNKIYYIDTDSPSLYTDFDIFKKNGLEKIHADFLVIVNKSDILACDLHTLDVVNVPKQDIYKNIEFFFPLLGVETLAGSQNVKSVDIKVAEKFARLYNEIALSNNGDERLSADILCRLLFCCFADSTGRLADESLASIISLYTEPSGSDTPAFLRNLLLALRTTERDDLPHVFQKVSFVDSRLFAVELPDFTVTKDTRQLILDLLMLDWRAVTPEILGALIQSIAVPSASSICGNYTATANIQKLIGPLFMNELYSMYEDAIGKPDFLLRLLVRVRSISILDPACGTGNFLLVAYKELQKLSELITEQLRNSDTRIAADPHVSAHHFYGIEERAFSCEIAKLGFLFAVYQQTTSFESALEEYFSMNIINGDPLAVDWASVCDGTETYIIGNPSYRGANRQTPTQKRNLQRVFAEYNNCKNLDYAACWFLLAAKYLKQRHGGFAFVTTNSLTQGNQVQMLWPKLYALGFYIQFAHTSFKWKNDARNRTTVTVVIIGMLHSNARRERCELYLPLTINESTDISPYLVPGRALIGAKATSISGLPEMVKGNMPYDSGHLLLSPLDKDALIRESPASQKFLRRVVGSDEFINGRERWCLWVREEDANDALRIPGINDRANQVRQSRLSNQDMSVRRIASRHYQFRDIKETHSHSLVIPAVYSENYLYPPIGFIFHDTIATNLVSVIYDCEPWIFGVIASRMHSTWIATVCGKLEERIRYSLKLGYNTFPIPALSDDQKSLINKCVFNVVKVREAHSGDTLASLYHKDRMPDDLKLAHSILDEVIDKCYRDEPFLSDEERLIVLFDLYEELEEQDNG